MWPTLVIYGTLLATTLFNRIFATSTWATPHDSFLLWRDSATFDNEDFTNPRIVDVTENAKRVRELTRDSFPDLNARDILGLERLHRLSVLAMKATATPEQLEWAEKWDLWWSMYATTLTGSDQRSSADRLYAYTIDRKLGFLKSTPEIYQFELDFDLEYRSSDAFRDSQPQKLCPKLPPRPLKCDSSL